MKPVKAILAFDTSNYRTSVCLIDLNGNILGEAKELLKVPPGSRGLQQSEAVFQHIVQLPQLMEQIFKEKYNIVAVAVSSAPRPVKDSYMPVFRVGEMTARSLSASLNIPLYKTTHQEGHIAAGEFTLEKRPLNHQFLAVHLSGGTSEILYCTRTNTGYEIKLIGGSLDLHVGQLIDRVGVALGLPFPLGPSLEKLALEAEENSFSVPSSVKETYFHLSGPETALLKAVRLQQAPPAEIARSTETVIANSLEKTLRYAVEKGYPREILIVGGVAANQYIRERLVKRLEHPAVGSRLFFAKPEYSGDNAYGVARIGLLQWNQAQKSEH